MEGVKIEKSGQSWVEFFKKQDEKDSLSRLLNDFPVAHSSTCGHKDRIDYFGCGKCLNCCTCYLSKTTTQKVKSSIQGLFKKILVRLKAAFFILYLYFSTVNR